MAKKPTRQIEMSSQNRQYQLDGEKDSKEMGGKHHKSDEEERRVKKENEQMLKKLKVELLREKEARTTAGPGQLAQGKEFQSNMGGKRGSRKKFQQSIISEQGVGLSGDEERQLRAHQADVIHRLEETAESQGQLSPSMLPPSRSQHQYHSQFPEPFPRSGFSNTAYGSHQQPPNHSSAISTGHQQTSQAPVPHSYNRNQKREAARAKAKKARERHIPVTCGNCGAVGHLLDTCPIPDEDGYLRGCPVCNVKWHSLADCPYIHLSAHTVWEYVRLRRHGLCPLEFHLDWRLFQNPGNPNADWHYGLPNTAWNSKLCAMNPGAFAQLDPYWTFETTQPNVGSECTPNARVSGQRRTEWDAVVASLYPSSAGYSTSGPPQGFNAEFSSPHENSNQNPHQHRDFRANEYRNPHGPSSNTGQRRFNNKSSSANEDDRPYPRPRSTNNSETRKSAFRERSHNTDGRKTPRHTKRKRSQSADSFNKNRDHHRRRTAKGKPPAEGRV